MMTLLFPQSKNKNGQLDEYKEAVSFFRHIFQDNNTQLRTKFFRDPLIKYLWGTIFITECKEVCKSYLRKVRSQTDQGETKFMRLFKLMLQLEEQFKFKLLPECARNPYTLKVMDREEELEYYTKNAKYHKR